MRLSPKMKTNLFNEIGTALKHMRATDNPAEKLFFFSAVYGAAFRIVNIEFDPELSFLHLVTAGAHNMMSVNLAASLQPRAARTFPKEVFDMLQDALEDLANKIQKDEETYPVLQRIYNLAYSTTGNGYYLHLKGIPLVQ